MEREMELTDGMFIQAVANGMKDPESLSWSRKTHLRLLHAVLHFDLGYDFIHVGLQHHPSHHNLL